MTKQELLDKLSSDYEAIGDPVLIEDTLGINVYDLSVFEVTATSATKKTISFYVKNEGEEEESAYLRSNADDSVTFQSEVETEIENQKSLKNILTGKISEVDEANKFAIVKAFLANETGAVQKDYLYRKNGENIDILLLA